MNNTKNISVNNPFLVNLVFLGFLEFIIAGALILQVAPDPNNAIIFGYSIWRLGLFVLALLPAGILLLLLKLASYRTYIFEKVEAVFQKKPVFWGFAIFFLALLAIVVLVTPFEMLGKYGSYFERARPLLFFLCLFPAQISLNWFKKDWHLSWVRMRVELISLGILLALGCFIFFSGLGITPEKEHWNGGGNPFTSLQLTIILFIGVVLFGLFRLVNGGFLVPSKRYFDAFILIALFVGTVLIWQGTPVRHNEFSTRPIAPYFQSFPISDARIHDIGALAVLKGAGILFRSYTDKPLYMVFLAILHIFAGYDYNLLSFLQICFLALIVPSLYVIGKSFHSRMFGFVLACIVLVRQQNAILLSNILQYNVLPTQLMTEVPTLLGLVIATGMLFFWIKNYRKNSWRAFVAGGTLGAVSLVRLNPFLLIPATPIFLLLSMLKCKKDWVFQTMLFLLGSCILIVPWILTGTNQAGQSFFILKFQDIINVRYAPIGTMSPVKDLTYLSEAPSSLPTISAGLSFIPVDIHVFPGFVINHTLHNFVASVLNLPDSLQPDDQTLAILMERPFWKLGIEQLSALQIPFILLNLCLLAIGLAWSWKRWNWAGLSPLFVFAVYSLSLGLGRTSGSRYLIPMDWVADFYFALGLICLFAFLPPALRQAVEAVPESQITPRPNEKMPSWIVVSSVASIICVAALIPIAQGLIPPQKELCQQLTLDELKLPSSLSGNLHSDYLIYGEVIYPQIKKNHFNFSLLTCKQELSFEITGFSKKLDVGQRVIVGLTNDDLHPQLEFIALPPDGENPGRILWQVGSK